jgi:hypothetical protein
VNDHVEVLLGGVLGDIGEGEGLGHDCGCWYVTTRCVCVGGVAALVNESEAEVFGGRCGGGRGSSRETVECGGGLI